MRFLAGFAVVIGILLCISGFLLLSEATMGAGLIALACFLGIVARIMQAQDYHAHLIATLRAGQPAVLDAPAPKSTAAAEEWIAGGARR